MPLATGHPSMSHSPAYYDNRLNISTTPHAEYGPASSHVQQPPAAHLYQQRRSLSPVAPSPASHQSSESGRFPKRAQAGETHPTMVEGLRLSRRLPSVSHYRPMQSRAQSIMA